MGYAAVGMCGYEPPDEHKLRMIHALPGDHECAVVLKFLASMMNLADHLEDWRIGGKKRLVWNAEQKSEHKKARACRECRSAFDSKKKGCGKVTHHEHGTGAFLGLLCQDCDKAAHKPSHVRAAWAIAQAKSGSLASRSLPRGSRKAFIGFMGFIIGFQGSEF